MTSSLLGVKRNCNERKKKFDASTLMFSIDAIFDENRDLENDN